jgi:dual specificity MAP kinase phosphatase
MLAGLKCKEVHLIHDIQKFWTRYSFLCSESLSCKDFPNEIIPGFLYLGSAEHAHSFEILEMLKVTHILNATKSLASPFSGLRYCRVDVEDKESEKISLWFEQAFDFIEEAAKLEEHGKKGVVLVHCAKGVSRSATLVIMYLMRAARMSLEESLNFIKRHREVVEPNDGFMIELQEFEKNNNEFLRVDC